MIEVYKTNVKKRKQAKRMVKIIKRVFPEYKINFDLEDCDNILRIENELGKIDNDVVVKFVNRCGYTAEVLSDMLPIVHKARPNDRKHDEQ